MKQSPLTWTHSNPFAEIILIDSQLLSCSVTSSFRSIVIIFPNYPLFIVHIYSNMLTLRFLFILGIIRISQTCLPKIKRLHSQELDVKPTRSIKRINNLEDTVTELNITNHLYDYYAKKRLKSEGWIFHFVAVIWYAIGFWSSIVIVEEFEGQRSNSDIGHVN